LLNGFSTATTVAFAPVAPVLLDGPAAVELTAAGADGGATVWLDDEAGLVVGGVLALLHPVTARISAAPDPMNATLLFMVTTFQGRRNVRNCGG